MAILILFAAIFLIGVVQCNPKNFAIETWVDKGPKYMTVVDAGTKWTIDNLISMTGLYIQFNSAAWDAQVLSSKSTSYEVKITIEPDSNVDRTGQEIFFVSQKANTYSEISYNIESN